VKSISSPTTTARTTTVHGTGGEEGPTSDPSILELRARQSRAMLATLILSLGVPMLLGGDEIGRTQQGNNNAYCQDNEISWFDWSKVDEDLLAFTSRLNRDPPAPSLPATPQICQRRAAATTSGGSPRRIVDDGLRLDGRLDEKRDGLPRWSARSGSRSTRPPDPGTTTSC